MRDLAKGGVREISCSVIWPAHQETFGAVGIVVEPRTIADIHSMCVTDAGHSAAGGAGAPPSAEAVADTFEKSHGHNEWVLTGAEVKGIFVNLGQPVEVARRMPMEAFPEEIRHLAGDGINPAPITFAEIASDFPGLPFFSFFDGVLKQFQP